MRSNPSRDEAHTAERLRAGEVLAAVTSDPEPVQGCKTLRLGGQTYLACASPAYVQRHFAAGVSPDALARAPYLRFGRRDRLQARWAKEAHGVELKGPVHWVPSAADESLYLRPFMIATQVGLGVNSPSSSYTYLTIASPAGPYFSGGVHPVKVWLSTEYTRAAPGGNRGRSWFDAADRGRAHQPHRHTRGEDLRRGQRVPREGRSRRRGQGGHRRRRNHDSG